jgi:alcohol dehydrogenase class IV
MVPVPTVPTKKLSLLGSQATPSGLLPDADGSSVKTLVAPVLCLPLSFPDAWVTATGPAAVTAMAAMAAMAVLIRMFIRAS